jgi:hypothetical protein
MTETKEEFLEAVENDELAEFELPTGDILVTDWEGDGHFDPYILPKSSAPGDEIVAEILEEAIRDVFDFDVEHVEWASNGTYKVRAER